MIIAIIGSGNVGSALGKGWLRAGHKIVFGVRNPDSPKTKKALELAPDAEVKSVEEASENGEVIVITTPADAVSELIPRLGNITNKIIIDTTNAIRVKPDPYPTAFHAIKAIANAGHVVKCFNTTGFENMLNPLYNGVGIDMFSAGNSVEAKKVADQLAKDLGFAACYDFGGDDKVELLEKLAFSWINIAIMQGHGRNLAFKLIKR